MDQGRAIRRAAALKQGKRKWHSGCTHLYEVELVDAASLHCQVMRTWRQRRIDQRGEAGGEHTSAEAGTCTRPAGQRWEQRGPAAAGPLVLLPIHPLLCMCQPCSGRAPVSKGSMPDPSSVCPKPA